MTNIRVCPDNILKLFENESTKSEGRRLAVEWMKNEVIQMRLGEKIFIPNPETGELIEMKYEPKVQ